MMNMNMMTNINMMKNKSSVQGHNNNILYRTPSSPSKKKIIKEARIGFLLQIRHSFLKKICTYHYKILIIIVTFILLKKSTTSSGIPNLIL